MLLPTCSSKSCRLKYHPYFNNGSEFIKSTNPTEKPLESFSDKCIQRRNLTSLYGHYWKCTSSLLFCFGRWFGPVSLRKECWVCCWMVSQRQIPKAVDWILGAGAYKLYKHWLAHIWRSLEEPSLQTSSRLYLSISTSAERAYNISKAGGSGSFGKIAQPRPTVCQLQGMVVSMKDVDQNPCDISLYPLKHNNKLTMAF